MKPRITGARRSSDLTSTPHAFPSAVLLAFVSIAALTLLTVQPLEMICGAVIVWRSRGGA